MYPALMWLGTLLLLSGSDPPPTAAFRRAVEFQDVATIRRLLEKSPTLVLVEDEHGSTALNRAVSQNNLELVKILIEAKSDVNHDSRREGRPLGDACFYGKEKIVKLLLDARADVNIQAEKGMPGHDVGTALHQAAAGGHLNLVKLIVEHGGNVNAIAKAHYQVTPLHQAISPEPGSKERAAIVRFLLEKGANVNAKDANGWTPLRHAKELGEEFDEIAEILVSHRGK